MELELNSELLMDARCGNGLSADELRHFFLNYSFRVQFGILLSIWAGGIYVENFEVRYRDSSEF